MWSAPWARATSEVRSSGPVVDHEHRHLVDRLDPAGDGGEGLGEGLLLVETGDLDDQLHARDDGSTRPERRLAAAPPLDGGAPAAVEAELGQVVEHEGVLPRRPGRGSAPAEGAERPLFLGRGRGQGRGQAPEAVVHGHASPGRRARP